MDIRLDGIIYGYSNDVSAGIIRCSDGKKYQFSRNDWRSVQQPQIHSVVKFALEGPRAVRIDAA